MNFGWRFLPAMCLGAVAGALVGTVLALVTLEMRDFILKLTRLAFGEVELKTNVWTALAAALIALYVAWRFDGSPPSALPVGGARRSPGGQRHRRVGRAGAHDELRSRRDKIHVLWQLAFTRSSRH